MGKELSQAFPNTERSYFEGGTTAFFSRKKETNVASSNQRRRLEREFCHSFVGEAEANYS